MARDTSDATPIASRDALVQWLESGCKKAGEPLRIGTEHEKIPFYADTLAPVPYHGVGGRGGVRAMIEGLQARIGWEPIMDRDALIGLADPRGGGAISLEPGGQFELSGAPLLDAHETARELNDHFTEVGAVAREIGIKFLDLGCSPKWSRAETPAMPKQRYAIMSKYMPQVGSRGLDMMFRTATVQVNLDFVSEPDMVKKIRVGLALQPIVTALFANSPFLDGRPTGRLSERSLIWRDTDPDRTGMLPFAFEAGFGFERYVDYALDVPMYFVKRGDVYHDVAGASFRDLLAGKLPQLPGERAVMSDWANHLSTIFPEVRLKTYLEMRGADSGPRSHMIALAALFAGLYYDEASLDEAYELVKGWGSDARETLRANVPAQGLSARIDDQDARQIARETLAISGRGLSRRARRNAAGEDEAIYLAPLQEMVEEGVNLAQSRLVDFKQKWRGSIDRAFSECVLPM
jgi:glutamate--cysteine ligase